MFLAAIRLLLSSFYLAVGWMGDSPLGIVATLVSLFGPQIWSHTSGQKPITKEAIKQIWVGAKVTFYIWSVVLFFAFAWTIYDDHRMLVVNNAGLERQLRVRDTLGLSFQIGGFITSGVDGDSTKLQLTIVAFNQGDPVTVHDWKVVVKSAKETYAGFVGYGETLVRGSLDLPRIDERLETPIDTEVQLPGLISFILPHVPQSQIDSLSKDPTSTITVSATDSLNRPISTTVRIPDLYAQFHRQVPSQ